MHVEIFLILGCVVRPFSEMLEWNISIKNSKFKTSLLNDVETPKKKRIVLGFCKEKKIGAKLWNPINSSTSNKSFVMHKT